METKWGNCILDTNSSGGMTLRYDNDNLASACANMCQTAATRTTISDYITEVCRAAEKKPEVSPETRTKLDIRNGKIYVKHYKDGYYEAETFAISDIKDVKHHGNAIIVAFADGTKTKAVLDAADEFALEQGISICITKKLLGKDGDSVYNKLINRALKVKKRNEDAVKKAEAKKLEKKRRKEATAAKKARKKLKKREEQIEIQKEAYIRAMKVLDKDKHKDKNKKKKFSKNS